MHKDTSVPDKYNFHLGKQLFRAQAIVQFLHACRTHCRHYRKLIPMLSLYFVMHAVYSFLRFTLNNIYNFHDEYKAFRCFAKFSLLSTPFSVIMFGFGLVLKITGRLLKPFHICSFEFFSSM